IREVITNRTGPGLGPALASSASEEQRRMADTKPKTAKGAAGEPGAKKGAGGGRGRVKMVSNPAPIDEIYVDGISGILGRSSVCKLDCYRVVGVDRDDGNAEIRRVTHRVVIPTSALPELIQMIKTMTESGESK